MIPKPLTVDQVAELLGVHYDTVLARIGDGRIRATNIGTKGRPTYRITEEALQAFIDGSTKQPPPPAPVRNRRRVLKARRQWL